MVIPFQTAAEIRDAIPVVIRHLRSGGLVGYPTETVYGVGSLAEERALQQLAAMKGRAGGKPFLLLVSSRAMAENHGLVFTPSADLLSQAFWPGPLTLVLAGAEGRLPDSLRGREGGIAVRHTSQKAMAELIRALGQPLTSTSANRPGGPPAPGAAHVEELFPDAVASGALLVLDGGVLGNVPPSTLVDCTTSVPRLVREGALPRSELRRAAGRLAP